MSRVRVPLTFRIYQGDTLVKETTLAQQIVKIGKLSSSHLCLEDDEVSRVHAVIESSAAGDICIIDLGSTRGTFVNGQKINKAVLRSGDRIEVGNTRIELAVAETADANRPSVRLAHPGTIQARPPVPSAPPVPGSARASHRRLTPETTPATATPATATPVFGGDASVMTAGGDRAVEVAAMMGDSLVGVKHLGNPHAGRISRITKALFVGGAAMLIMASVAFVAGLENAEFNKTSKAAWAQSNQPVHDWRPHLISPAFDWMAFGGLATGLFALTLGLVRVRNERKSPYFRIGDDADVEFPTSAAPSPSFPLVAPRGDAFVCNFTASMSGELVLDGQRTALADLVTQGRATPSESMPGVFTMAISTRARIRVNAGQNTFLITSVAKPTKQVTPLFGSVEARTLAFFAGSAIVHLGLWAFLRTLPPSPHSLVMEFGSHDARISRVNSKAHEEPVNTDEPVKEERPEAGGTGTAMALESGKMGTEESTRKTGRHAIERTHETTGLAREEAMRQARTSGIIGVMKQRSGGLASLTGGDFSSGLDDATIMGGLLGDEAGAMQGGFGFGRSGFGPGADGTGWGTVGSGMYGTIGQGSGTGEGYSAGGGRGLKPKRQGAVPSVHIGQATPSPGLDKNIIRRYVRQKLPRIKYCYEKQLIAQPGLSGTVLSDFQITPQGAVLGARATGVSRDVSNCVAEVISTIRFPAPKNNLMVQVKYPFTFRPSGG